MKLEISPSQNWSINTTNAGFGLLDQTPPEKEEMKEIAQAIPECPSFESKIDIYMEYLNTIKTEKKIEPFDINNERVSFKYRLNELYKARGNTHFHGFTFTFKQKFHQDDPKFLHNYVYNKISKSRIWKNKKFVMFPEFTKNGILHYHGVIIDEWQIESVRLINWWRRLFGFVKPELEVNNRDRFIKYITKDRNKNGLWSMSHLDMMWSDTNLFYFD